MFHCDQNDLIVDVLLQIAQETHKPLERVKRLLLIKQNQALNRRFWEIIDHLLRPATLINMLGAAVNAAPLSYVRNHLSKLNMTPKFTIQQILLSNQNWWNFYNKNQHKIIPSHYFLHHQIIKLQKYCPWI